MLFFFQWKISTFSLSRSIWSRQMKMMKNKRVEVEACWVFHRFHVQLFFLFAFSLLCFWFQKSCVLCAFPNGIKQPTGAAHLSSLDRVETRSFAFVCKLVFSAREIHIQSSQHCRFSTLRADVYSWFLLASLRTPLNGKKSPLHFFFCCDVIHN